MRVKYEFLVKHPAECTSAIIRFAQAHGMPFVEDSEVAALLQRNNVLINDRHIVGGNPGVKLQSGLVSIRKDDTWIDELPRIQRVLWTILFLPWLPWFGYELWPKRQAPR